MKIYMWSGPRNLSTVLMRSFENRADTEVWDEPLYAYYLNETKKKHPMRDEIIKNYPKMVYVSSINPREIKGPHIHTKRTSHFVCIHGKVLFIVKNNDGTYSEIESSDEHPVLIHIPKNIASAHINLSTDTSRVLALADISWKPNDNEMINTIFDDYDWKKWI